MSDHVPDRCDFCGVTDDHPKWIGALANGWVTKHHDCMSADERASVEASNPVAAEVIKACVDGKHGDELRKYILSLHAEKSET